MFVKVEEIDKKVGMNIRLERTKRSISQEKLAEMSDISPTTMGTVERGDQSPSLQTIAKVANALKIEIGKLFIFDD